MKANKEKRKWGLMIVVLIIMIGTTFSIVVTESSSSPSQKSDYSGTSFSRDGSKWIAKISGNEAAFTFLPSEVEKISAPPDLPSRLQSKFEIDSTYDFNSTYAQSIALAQHQMGLTLQSYNVYLRNGFTTNTTYNFPIIKCSGASQSVPLIYFRHANVTGIHLEKDCIIAEASSGTDFIKVKDRLLYALFGVLK